MKLIETMHPECVVVNAEFSSKKEALRAIAEIAKRNPALDDASVEEISERLTERESIGSTGFGKGIAIPHCRLDSARGFVVGLVTVPAGVPFDALDDQPVQVIAFIIAPAQESTAHLRLLSGISSVLGDPKASQELLAAKAPEALRESFLRRIGPEPEDEGAPERNLVHVFVQDEGLFRDLLRVLSTVEAGGLAIVEAENTGAYLSKMPLFAGFWRDHEEAFCRIVTVIIDRRMTNETLRRIQSITGDLKERTDVLVTVHELAYAAGAIRTHT